MTPKDIKAREIVMAFFAITRNMEQAKLCAKLSCNITFMAVDSKSEKWWEDVLNSIDEI